MATTTAKMMITPIAFNPDHLSSSTTTTTTNATAITIMVTTTMMHPAAHVSSISFCRPRAATTSYVSLKAWSSRCSPWRTITKSGCEIHQPTMDESQNDHKGSHLECSESPMMEKMYQVFRTEEELYRNLLESAHHWERFKTMKKIYLYYKKAVYKSRHPNKHSIVTSNSAVASALFSMLKKYPYKIPVHIQKAIRAPFDYYEFGRKYFRPLIDFKNSYVGNIVIFQEIEEKIRKGENVILFSNHQHDADHVISALLLEYTHPFISENLTYFVEEGLSDSFYNIFNMGRNILNCYVTESKLESLEDQIRQLLRSGSQIICYTACEGSKHPVTQEYFPTIDRNSDVAWVISRACESNVPFHTYPLGLLSLPPPPIQVEKDVEKFRKSRRRHESDWYEQVISFHGVGLSIGHEMLNFKQHVYNYTAKEKLNSFYEFKTMYLDTVLDSVMNQYKVLRSAIHEKQGLAASNHTVSLSQPFDFLT